MYVETAARRSSVSSSPSRPSRSTAARAAHASTPPARAVLAQELNSRDAAVSVTEDELDEALVGDEVARARAAAEGEAALSQLGLHHKRAIGPLPNLHAPQAEDLDRKSTRLNSSH